MASQPTGDIRQRDEGRVQWLIFDQPAKHNALSLRMVKGALEAVRAFSANEQQRVLVLTGGGDRAFVSGADISEFDSEADKDAGERHYLRLSTELFDAVADCPKPTIAIIHGYCFGGGVALAAACDLRYAADDALFSIPAAKLGIAYSLTFAKWVTDLVGPAAAREMLYSGRRYDSAEVERLQLVNRVYDKQQLDAEVAKLADTIANNAPLSIRSTKQTIRYLLADPTDRDRAACEALISTCAESQDFAEGRAAFAEKRTPNFKGR